MSKIQFIVEDEEQLKKATGIISALGNKMISIIYSVDCCKEKRPIINISTTDSILSLPQGLLSIKEQHKNFFEYIYKDYTIAFMKNSNLVEILFVSDINNV